MQVAIYAGDVKLNLGDKTRTVGEIFLMDRLSATHDDIFVRIQAAEDAAVSFTLTADNARILIAALDQAAGTIERISTTAHVKLKFSSRAAR